MFIHGSTPFVYNESVLIFSMEIKKINMFQRLRDFKVPSAVLDEIFSNEKDLKTMEESWSELESNGMKHDEIAEAMLTRIELYDEETL